MNSKPSVPVSPPTSRLALVAVGMCLFILAVGAGLLALSSCSTSPEGIAREDVVIQTLSNAVGSLQQMVPYTPRPAGDLVEPLLALATTGLAIWSGYLHRNVRVLVKAANGSLTAANGATPRPPG